nr:MAG TPA: hypothetical protein [Caudoviricetes sp.]
MSSSDQPPFRKLLKAAHELYVFACNRYNVRIRFPVHGCVSDGTAERHRRTGFLRFEKRINVYADIRFGEVFSVQTASCNRIRHIRAEFAVGGTGIDIRSAGPVTERVDFRIRTTLTEFFGRGIALTDNQPLSVQNIFSVIAEPCKQHMRKIRKGTLLVRNRDTFENAVVTAADSVCLIIGEMPVLRDFFVVNGKVAGNPVNRFRYGFARQRHRGFRNDVAYTVTDENFHGNTGIRFFCICHIHQGTGNAVGKFIGMARVHFFKHKLSFPCTEQSFHQVILRIFSGIICCTVFFDDLKNLIPQTYRLVHVIDSDIDKRRGDRLSRGGMLGQESHAVGHFFALNPSG